MTLPIQGNQRVIDDVAAATKMKRGCGAPTHDERIIRSRIDGPLIDRFIAEAEAAGMRVSRTTGDGLPRLIATIIESGGGGITLLEPALAADRPDLGDLPNVITEATEAELYGATHGVVSADTGIAETGSLVRRSDARRPRGFALVPMTIIFVLGASKITADLYDILSIDDPANMPSEMVIITGPSKTADIGMKLVTGIHGPGVVHIALVDES